MSKLLQNKYFCSHLQRMLNGEGIPWPLDIISRCAIAGIHRYQNRTKKDDAVKAPPDTKLVI